MIGRFGATEQPPTVRPSIHPSGMHFPRESHSVGVMSAVRRYKVGDPLTPFPDNPTLCKGGSESTASWLLPPGENGHRSVKGRLGFALVPTSKKIRSPKLSKAWQPQAGGNSVRRVTGVIQSHRRVQRDDPVQGILVQHLARDGAMNLLQPGGVGEEPEERTNIQLRSIEVQEQLKLSEVREWERGFERWTKTVGGRWRWVWGSRRNGFLGALRMGRSSESGRMSHECR